MGEDNATAHPISAGKVPADLLTELLAGFPPHPSEVRLGPAVGEAARFALSDPGISVVEAALLAAGQGAVAMYDPTEGGIAAGPHELASASGVGLVVDRRPVLWFDPGTAVCDASGADPWATLASGSLLAAFHQNEPRRPCVRWGPVTGQRSSPSPSRARGCVTSQEPSSHGRAATRSRACCPRDPLPDLMRSRCFTRRP